jgi:hypothetical protein
MTHLLQRLPTATGSNVSPYLPVYGHTPSRLEMVRPEWAMRVSITGSPPGSRVRDGEVPRVWGGGWPMG